MITLQRVEDVNPWCDAVLLGKAQFFWRITVPTSSGSGQFLGLSSSQPIYLRPALVFSFHLLTAPSGIPTTLWPIYLLHFNTVSKLIISQLS